MIACALGLGALDFRVRMYALLRGFPVAKPSRSFLIKSAAREPLTLVKCPLGVEVGLHTTLNPKP